MQKLKEIQDLQRMLAALAPDQDWNVKIEAMCDSVRIPDRQNLNLELQRRFNHIFRSWAKDHLQAAVAAARADMQRELESQVQDLLPSTIAELAKLYK